jgi:hypothetical protein
MANGAPAKFLGPLQNFEPGVDEKKEKLMKRL